jgi:hypothetical protein
MLMQIPDAAHVRVGFKAHKEDPWYLSQPFDVRTIFGEKLGKIDPLMGLWGGVFRGATGGSGIGNFSSYPQFLIEYVIFRRKLVSATIIGPGASCLSYAASCQISSQSPLRIANSSAKRCRCPGRVQNCPVRFKRFCI